MNKELERSYYTPGNPSAYAGADQLIQLSRKKYSRRDIEEWLASQDAYNLHRLVRRKFPRRSYNVFNVDDVWEVDLADMRVLNTYNDGFTYILVAIDVFSKFVWTVPIKNKTASCVASSFIQILNSSNNRFPRIVQSDKGREFTGREFQKVLRDNCIEFRTARDPDIKASVVERFLRTLKSRLWRYFTHKNTKRYIDVLSKIIDSYNHTRHSSTKMTPASVTIYNAAEARKNLIRRYEVQKLRKKPKYSVGTVVRVSRAPKAFQKAYESGWTLELFKIARISTSRRPYVYILEDLSGEEIDGFYYEEELCKVNKNTDSIFEIEKIITTKGKGRFEKSLVKWKGYPDKFNSWVATKDLVAV